MVDVLGNTESFSILFKTNEAKIVQASRLISAVPFHFRFQIVNGVSQIAQYNNMTPATQFL
jgi:hypothetical protein